MTGTDDSTTNEDSDDTERATDSSEETSSLEDLAESVRQRRKEEGSITEAEDTDIDLSLDQDADEGPADEEAPFEWFSERTNNEVDEVRDPLDAVNTASNVLVLDPGRGKDSDKRCIDLLTRHPAEHTDILFVTVTRTPDDRIATWRHYSEDSPRSMTVISLGKETRTSEKSTKISTQGGPGDITIETLSDPSDLTRLGITLTRHLESTSVDSQTSVCVHSLTALLQYVEPNRLFRFLHILKGKLESDDTNAHYHIDPDAHDPQTIHVFESLFDAVIRISDDGDLEVVSEPE